MIALGIIVVLTIYLLISFGTAIAFKRKFKSWKAFWITLLVFFLIPTADDFIGRSYYKHLCGTRGGIKVYKTVPVEGYLNSISGSGAFAEDALKRGYRYMDEDYYREQGKLFRYVLDKGDKLLKKPIQSASSKYVFYKKTNSNFSFGIINKQYIVENRITGERLGLGEAFSYFGGWVAKIPRRIGIQGGSLSCPGSVVIEVVYQTLPPLDHKE